MTMWILRILKMKAMRLYDTMMAIQNDVGMLNKCEQCKGNVGTLSSDER